MGARLRTTLFYVLTAVMVWVLIEACAMAGYAIKYQRLFSSAAVRALMTRASRAEPAPQDASTDPDASAYRSLSTQVIHPYLGYVTDPYRARSGATSIFGLLAEDSPGPIVKKGHDKIVIGIFGGSFAGGIHRLSSSRLIERLESPGREVIFLNFALGGYKQPQQLMALAYMLSLGAEFDIVLSVDGFNETTLPVQGNIARGTNPFYPWHWSLRVDNFKDPASLKLLGRLLLLEERRQKWANLFVGKRLHWSPTFSLIWQFGDSRLFAEAHDQRQQIERGPSGAQTFRVTAKSLACLREKGLPKTAGASLRALKGKNFSSGKELLEAAKLHLSQEIFSLHQEKILRCSTVVRPFVGTGPPYSYANQSELYLDLATTWKLSSFQMKALCDANGIRYYHFLQPNQYVEGSKKMTAKERRLAITPNHPYRYGVEQGYPLLRENGRQLREKGVLFFDLTMMFAENREVLYKDSCCHLNKRGYDLVADRIHEAILKSGFE